MDTDSESQPRPLICDRCAKAVHPGQADFFAIRIEAFADPTPPEITEDDLQRDHRREIEKLIAAMQRLSEQQAMDQVYRRKNLILCNGCCDEWMQRPLGDA